MKDLVAVVIVAAGIAVATCNARASGDHGNAIARNYVTAPAAPFAQAPGEALAKSAGCVDCHERTDLPTMHASPAVVLGCTDCHGGDASVRRDVAVSSGSAAYALVRDRAHVLPRFPDEWRYPASANPERSYTLLNREAPEFIRFVNPSDYRVVREACGACHLKTILAAERSLMSTNAMFWGGAAYNNGLLPFKNYMLGEAYTRDGRAAILEGPPASAEQQAAHGILPRLYPLPKWQNLEPADVFRVFEDGGRNLSNLFPETGLPNVSGLIQRLEEPGRPDIRQSNRGPGTGARIAVPVLNMHKTRLNDPLAWFLGTNDQPGDYRSSGCSACHVIYANDRDPRHSGPYARFGHGGATATSDPTIARGQPGHPLKHGFSRAIPTSQCMVCHMHQPNMFLNTFLGYTMWDYESDAPAMWPKTERRPGDEEMRRALDRNPEGAVVRGLWSDPEFLARVSELNPTLKDTQFADYHGHGWNFRAVFKRDRRGNLLDAEGRIVADDDPGKFGKAVQLSSIHMDAGMHCVDCHFAQDAHGNGHLYGEVAQAVEIDCKDCHGTATAYPTLRTSGPAADPNGSDLSLLRNPDGRRRFEWREGRLYQRSVLDPGLEWEVSLVRDSVTSGHPHYNARAARAKLMSRDPRGQAWGPGVPASGLAHSDDKMECYACHTSWTTACGGCHLPIEANWKTESHHYEGGVARNWASYNPQVARDDFFMLGLRGPTDGGKIAPVRSSSALVLSSTNANRERIYVQQAPISASGFSSQAMNPHYPHTERKTETRVCTDCHLSAAGDNNAVLAQTLGHGTQFMNLLGFNAWVGTEGEVVAVQVTEWDEPQAVIGSYLHRYAYPARGASHLDRGLTLTTAHRHQSDVARCLQLRGEYLFVAEGAQGLVVYDAAGIANKGMSQPLITAPFSPLGHDTRVRSRNATCVALPTTQPIHPARNTGQLMRVDNLEQAFKPIYDYALVTDAEEGLILVDVNTLADGNFRNNRLRRALAWDGAGRLKGARHVTIGGSYAYVIADAGLVIVDLQQPLKPVIVASLPLHDGRASALQFRYLFVTDADGLKVVDVTRPGQARLLPESSLPLGATQGIFVARTYAYVANGPQGLAIVDIGQPERPRLLQQFTADGEITDARDVVVASTNASLFAYVADGSGGLKVLQLTAPDTQPNFYGFSPEPRPRLIARFATHRPALSLSRPLERDRAVDETGGQVAVFGRRGARPFNDAEMRRMYLDQNGEPWHVQD
ncbi:MAG: hypothetical protein WAW79_08165 [Steroidobacteraceae bacterium]